MAISRIAMPQAKPPTDGDGNAIRNKVLSNLPTEACREIFSELAFVRLKLDQIVISLGPEN